MSDAKVDNPAPEPAAVPETSGQTGDHAEQAVAQPAESAAAPAAENTTDGKAGDSNPPAEAADKDSSAPQKRRRDDDRSSQPVKRSKKGNMFDPTVQDITDDPVAIRKQVEFYFSDANLARDKFLFDKIEGPSNTPVDIKTIHSFKRMRRFQPYEAVVKALKESDVLEVTEDEKLKRKEALSADFENKTLEEITKAVDDESMARSVYVKGFGFEKPSSQFDIEAWFSDFGTTNQVRLRRLNDKTFKGSVFAEFDSEETAKKFLELDPKPKFNDRDLKVMTKKAYLDDKAQALKDGVIRPTANGGFEPTAKSGRRDNNGRDWRERREEDRKNGFRGGSRGSSRGHRGRGRGGRGGFNRRDDAEKGDKSESEKAEKGEGEGEGEAKGEAKKSEQPSQEAAVGDAQ